MTAIRNEPSRDVGSPMDDKGEETATLPGRNIVVAIGINAYSHGFSSLGNAVNDAMAMVELLRLFDFEELEEAPSLYDDRATRDAISDLILDQLATCLRPDDSLLFFFAGHGDSTSSRVPDPQEIGGTIVKRTGYLIPVEGEARRRGTWIKLDALLDDIATLPALHIFVILDACKSGIALSSKFHFKGGALSEPSAIADLRRRSSRRVMTSAMHDQKAFDGGSGTGNSLFTEAIIAGLRDGQADHEGDGYIKSQDLFTYVQNRVSEMANKYYGAIQTPDYGQLAGDGSGDLVFSLQTGAFNHLIEQGLTAMLYHHSDRLQTIVDQVRAANASHPLTRYLQARLHFMQGEIETARQGISDLVALELPSGIIPLSPYELTGLNQDLRFWQPALSLPPGNPAIRVQLLTGTSHKNLTPAPWVTWSGGRAFAVDSGTIAQYEIQNQGTQSVYPYFITILPHGRMEVGPMLETSGYMVTSIEPGATAVGRIFHVQGFPGSLTETRIFISPEPIWPMQSRPSIATMTQSPPAPVNLEKMEVLVSWYQIPEGTMPALVSVRTIEAAFLT